MNKRIGILGCGWLGLPLAIYLKERGHFIKGTKTSPSGSKTLEKEGISAFAIVLGENGIQGDIKGFLSAMEVLVINIPPRLRNDPQANYYGKILRLYSILKEHPHLNVLFVSSTAVYGITEGEVNEDSPTNPTTPSGKQLLKCEILLIQSIKNQGSIIRFGGLIGPNRHPIFQLAGKTELKNGHHPVNLIHLNDCLQMMTHIIENGYWGEVFNGVYPAHPSKKDYYSKMADYYGLPTPSYSTNPSEIIGKTIICKNYLAKKHRLNTSIYR